MFAAESNTSRHYIAIVVMACLCVLLGGPSYAAGAESLIIAGAMYYEPGVSGPGWTWTDADHLELNGYAGEAIGADGDLVLTLAGQNSVTESHALDADITLCGMEVWGNLTLRGTGTLTATGSQCGIHVSQALVVDGCTVDARADGADIADEAVAGVIAGDMAAHGGGRFVAAGAGSGAGVRAYGVYLQVAGLGDGADKPPADANSTAGEPTTGPTANPALKPASAPTKTTTTVAKTTVPTSSRPKTATATTAVLPKTGDSHWIAVSALLLVLGTADLEAAWLISDLSRTH